MNYALELDKAANEEKLEEEYQTSWKMVELWKPTDGRLDTED